MTILIYEQLSFVNQILRRFPLRHVGLYLCANQLTTSLSYVINAMSVHDLNSLFFHFVQIHVIFT